MITRNHGVVNVVEKVKEYQKRKNLEIPLSFRGNSFAIPSLQDFFVLRNGG
jgi:hypothetical protein